MHICAAQPKPYVKLRDSEGRGLQRLGICLATTRDNELPSLILQLASELKSRGEAKGIF